MTSPVKPDKRERVIAELIWQEDGPVYSGWPSGGKRVDLCYWDQHPGERDRCFRLARAVLAKLRAYNEGAA